MDPDSKQRRSIASPGGGRRRRLRVSVTDARGRRIRDGGLSSWLASVAPVRAAGDVTVALVTDARIRNLNRQFRRIDRETDVLSFPVDSACPEPRILGHRRADRREGGPNPELGDIVIARGVAARQARDAGHSLQAELRVLALHGLLHLLGYDHHSGHDNGRMARAEARLRRRGGLRAGLIERSLRPSAGRAR